LKEEKMFCLAMLSLKSPDIGEEIGFFPSICKISLFSTNVEKGVEKPGRFMLY
jgi:hypothetical protein